MSDSYLIRQATEADMPLLVSWRRKDHVRRWWGPPETEPEAEWLRETRVAVWIGLAGDRPPAFIQAYAVADWSPHHFDYLPPGSRGMDLYIGEADALGRGHGVKIVRQHVDHLFDCGVPAVGIDPHPDNVRARRAFARAPALRRAMVPSTRGGVGRCCCIDSRERRVGCAGVGTSGLRPLQKSNQ